ncbi:MAG: tetratricopeptide repeat protein [Novosphingobium sp.]|nr:tetratricopeptide repeat protein [Novosphingobium sp.]MCP5403580.1 tetratricopeptide repeat protein [Novosphingobium sp.]
MAPTHDKAAWLKRKTGEAVSLYNQQQFGPAADLAAQLLQRAPTSAGLWYVFGLASNGLGKAADAERAFRKSAELKPGNADTHFRLGLLLGARREFAEAADAYRQALRIKPDHVPALCNLGVALRELGHPEEAIGAYREALGIDPRCCDAHFNLGNAFMAQGKLNEAAERYRQLLTIDPGHVEGRVNLGSALKELGRSKDAESCFRKALETAPGNAEAHNNLGVVLRQQGRLDEAVESYRQALEADPGSGSVRAKKLYLQAHICSWDAFAEFEQVKHTLGVEGEAVTPFSMLAFEDHPARQAQRSRLYSRQSFSQVPLPLPAQPIRREGKLRVGYFTANFREHAMTHLMAGMLREHDRSRFEIYAYSYSKERGGPMQEKVAQSVDKFVDIVATPDREVVDLARSHRLDIAIDLQGHTQHTRSRLFAWRLAPVQVNFLGYPGTMGADFIDYIVADPVVIAPAERTHYSEKLLQLPNSYFPTDNRQLIADMHTSRADFGLPESGFVFCCFNQNYKIGPREFDIWMRLLEQVDGSVLWLLRSNEWAEANLRKEATNRAIDPERLVFAGKLPNAEHLARHKHADLFVDTFNYNAHTTATDALWAGLPLVTRIGRQFSARVAASLLSAVGLPELITRSEAEYEALILELASDRARLAAITAKLTANRLTQALFDTVRYTRDFEAVLEAACRRSREGLPPADLRAAP